MTDECRIILDEALTASENGVAMSEKVTAHLGTCSECRRSLEAANALSASVGSVLPTEDTTALKLKISKKLEASMQARKAAALKTATSAIPLAKIGLSLAAALALGAYCLGSSNNNQASIKSNQVSSISETNSASSATKQNTLPDNIPTQDNEVYREIFSDGYKGDLRNFEKIKQPSSNSVPSATKD